jgi:AcrR family transcriptional regulator
VTDVVERDRYASLTVERVLARAGVSRATFCHTTNGRRGDEAL